MKFRPTPLAGVFIVEPDRHEDDRGFFARSWCRQEFLEQGLDPNLVQCNISLNHRAGTVRGKHFQKHPHEEVKLVRCTRGAICDVVIDLRPESSTRFQSFAVELTCDNRLALYLPAGFAHGFQTLADDSEVFYQMSREFQPASAEGIRWNDPLVSVEWPLAISVISDRDAGYPDFTG